MSVDILITSSLKPTVQINEKNSWNKDYTGMRESELMAFYYVYQWGIHGTGEEIFYFVTIYFVTLVFVSVVL